MWQVVKEAGGAPIQDAGLFVTLHSQIPWRASQCPGAPDRRIGGDEGAQKLGKLLGVVGGWPIVGNVGLLSEVVVAGPRIGPGKTSRNSSNAPESRTVPGV
jgi:hypothetical protein